MCNRRLATTTAAAVTTVGSVPTGIAGSCASASVFRGLDAGVYKVAEKAMRFYQDFFEFFEEIIIKPDRFIDSGESVVVPNAAHIRGRDGIETLARSALVFKVSAGRVTSIRLYQ